MSNDKPRKVSPLVSPNGGAGEARPSRAAAAPAERPATDAQVSKQMTGDAARMKEVYRKDPKVKMYIPLEPGETKEKSSQYMISQNGYITYWPKGVYFDCPKTAAEHIMTCLGISPEVEPEVQSANWRKDQREALDA